MTTAAIDANGNLTTIPDIPGLSIRYPFDGPTPPVSQAFAVKSITGIWHRGVDWVIIAGTPLVAVDDGKVVATFTDSWPHYGPLVPGTYDTRYGGYGNQALVEHSWGLTMYAHMQTVMVSPGQTVTRGQQLGDSDSTGISTGPHLHFECRLPDNATGFDPLPYINADEWEEFMATLTEDQKAFLLAQATDANVQAANWLIDNRGKLSPYALAADAAQFSAAFDTPATDDGVSKGIRRLTRLLKKMVGPVQQQSSEPADALVRDLSRTD